MEILEPAGGYLVITEFLRWYMNVLIRSRLEHASANGNGKRAGPLGGAGMPRGAGGKPVGGIIFARDDGGYDG